MRTTESWLKEQELSVTTKLSDWKPSACFIAEYEIPIQTTSLAVITDFVISWLDSFPLIPYNKKVKKNINIPQIKKLIKYKSSFFKKCVKVLNAINLFFSISNAAKDTIAAFTSLL